MSTLQAIGIIVGVVSGVSGVVLGIVNYWERRVSTRPRIVVRPRVWNLVDQHTKQIEKNVAIMEIRNVGQVPVIGSTIGFLPRWEWVRAITRFFPKRARSSVAKFMRGREQSKGGIIPTPEPLNGLAWTVEVRPQHVAMLRFSLEGLPDTDKLGRAFASTIVGDTFTASRRDMRAFAEERRAASI
jgi:hypothetical protein